MFGKKDGTRLSSSNHKIPAAARLIKKIGTNHNQQQPDPASFSSGTSYSSLIRQQQQQHQPYPGLYQQHVYTKQHTGREIPSNDVSESYLQKQLPLSRQQQQHQNVSAPNSTKGVRKFAPAFFSRKKKNHGSPSQHEFETNGNTSEEEEDTEIARLEDFEDIDPVYLGQLDDSQLNTVDEQEQGNLELMFNRRVEYILSNYQKPPPYPGSKNGKNVKEAEKLSSQLEDQDTPLLKQLLKDKQLTDNASMINFWQSGSQRHLNRTEQQIRADRLVSRTQNNPNVRTETSRELYEKRKQHYIFKINELEHEGIENSRAAQNRDAISDIIPPASGGGAQLKRTKQMNLSASVPDLSRSHNMEQMENSNFTVPRKPRYHIEPGELEALISHYRKSSLDNFAPYGVNSESISLYSSEDSSSYVPPSPYMSAEIPQWLQVYAKATPDHDQYLKWKMFRYPELDCWQTMLKRLYKKDLEQVVLWFEEYRAALSEELHRQKQLMHQHHYMNQQQAHEQQRQAQQQAQQRQQQQQQPRIYPNSPVAAAKKFDINAVSDNMRKTNV